MFKNSNLKQLQEMAKESSKKLNLELRIFDETMAEAIKGVPDSEKQIVEQVKGLSQRAINLAKNGKIEQAQQIIKDFNNERKDNK